MLSINKNRRALMHKLTKFFSRDNFQRSNFNQFSLLFLIIFSLVTCTNLFGQGITSAAIYGTVTDPNGNPLVGANVVALHVPTGTIYGTTTRANGDYNLPNLRVGGPYTLTFSFIGYVKQEQTDITLQLSQSLRQNFVASEEVFEAGEVVVTAERSLVLNAARTGAATNVVREQIDRLPSISRSFEDYYKLSPLFIGSSAAGRNTKYNNIQIDGANYNDLFGLGGGTPASQSNLTPISLDAIEEFQIVVSPYDVRQGGFTGAGINAITRSGTNKYRGSVFSFGRNEGFIGKSPDTIKSAFQDFSDYQAGFRFGGPIIENKLFFFVNGELTQYKRPLTRTFGNARIGTNTFTVPIDSIRALTNHLKTKYGYDPGSFESMNFQRESKKIFARLDYNLSASHKLTARWNLLDGFDDNTPSRGRGAFDIYAENGIYKIQNSTNSIALQFTSLFGNIASNELTIGYVHQLDQPVYYGSPFPTLYIRTTGAAQTQTLVLGSEQFRHQNELEQNYFEITNNFSMYFSDHTVTIGARLDMFKFRNLFIPSNFGVYTYNTLDDFLKDRRAASFEYQYSATADPLQAAKWGATQFGLYAQDEWTVSPRLKLTTGIRVEIPTYPDNPNYNRAVDTTFTPLGYDMQTNQPPKTSVLISPRFGFNWAVDEERNTQVRGGVGIFSGRFPYVWVSNMYSNTGVDFFTNTTVPTNFVGDPFNQPKPATGTLPRATVNLTDNYFKSPSILRANLAIDQKLPYDLVASLEGIVSWSQDEIYFQNIQLKPHTENLNAGLTPGGRLAGEKREVWGTWSATARRWTVNLYNSARFNGVYVLKNTDLGENANIIVQLQRQSLLDGFYANVAYTWGTSKDINSGASAIARSSWRFNPTPGNPNTPLLTYSLTDRTHRVLGVVSYKFDWSDLGLNINGFTTTVGLFYNGVSGRPFSYLVDGDINGDGERDNDLVYIPKDANDVILVSSAGAVLPKTDKAYTQLMDFIEADEYLKDNKGKLSERNAAREPWAHQIDLRISQEIPSIFGHRFEITFDILNVLNMINNEWGWVKQVANQNAFLLQFHSIETAAGADYGKPRYIWTNPVDPRLPNDLLSRWQAQLGIRYTF